MRDLDFQDGSEFIILIQNPITKLIDGAQGDGVLLQKLAIDTLRGVLTLASIAVRKNIFAGNRFNPRFNLLMARKEDNIGMGGTR